MTPFKKLRAQAHRAIARRDAALTADLIDGFCFACWHHHTAPCGRRDQLGVCGCDTPIHRESVSAHVRHSERAGNEYRRKATA